MSQPSVSLAFFKLNTADMDSAIAFYSGVFGFERVITFDEADFVEHGLALPGQENGPTLFLVQYKDGRDVTPGPGHGPVGLQTDDINALHTRALDAGAVPQVPVTELPGGVKVAIFRDPEGHEVEIVQLPTG